jgi:hypothetical protein
MHCNRSGVQGLPAFGGAEGDQGSEVQGSHQIRTVNYSHTNPARAGLQGQRSALTCFCLSPLPAGKSHQR